MRVLYDIQDMIEDELRKISKQDVLTGSDVDCIYKMVDILKDISTIEAMDSYEPERSTKWESKRYSGRSSYRDDNDEIISNLKEMMNEARSDEDRERYRRAIEQLNR